MKKFILLLLPLAMLTLASCGKPSTDSGTNSNGQPTPAIDPAKPDLSADQVKKLIDDGKSLTILDVRTPAEIQSGFIAGAEKIDFHDPAFKDKATALDKNKTTVVYCAVGGRSSQARQILKDAGFKEVYSMTGGITSWKEKNYAIVTP